MSTFVLGLNATTYRYESGAAAVVGESPTDWPLIKNIKDETVNLSAATSDVTTRGGNGWRQEVATLKEGSANFQMVFDPTSDDFTEFAAAFTGNTTIQMRFFDRIGEALDTPIGLEASFMVTSFNLNRNLEEAVMVDVEVRVSRGTTPTWYDGTVAL